MTDPGPAAPERSLHDILLNLDCHLHTIKQAAAIVLEAAITSDIGAELHDRLSLGARVIEHYPVKAEACSDEAFGIAKNAGAALRAEY